jgi:hypothetical protein
MRQIKYFITAVLTLLPAITLSAFTATANAALPQPFEATYNAQFDSMKVAAKRRLSYRDDGQMELHFSAKSFLAKVEEFSQFTWQDSGQLQPQRYEYHRTVLGKVRHAVLSFNWDTLTVRNNVQKKPWTMAIKPATLDKLSYQMQLRHDLINQLPTQGYAIADGGKLKHYDFEVIGTETLKIPLGTFKAVKVKRIRKDSNRETYLWFAEDWDYLLLRLQQREKDGKHYEINLSKASINEQQVKGL